MSSSYKIKLLLIGEAATGKTALMQRFIKNKFMDNYKMTVGVDILTKDIEYIPGEIATLSVWDIAGQERLKYIRKTFYKGATGAMILYDITRSQTLLELRKWSREFRSETSENIPILLVGNKTDLKDSMYLDAVKEEILNLAEKLNAEHIETSAKNGINVNECFVKMTQMIINNTNEKTAPPKLKSQRIQDLEEIVNDIANQPYGELEKFLIRFEKIQNKVEYESVLLLFNKILSLNLNKTPIFIVKLKLLKWLNNFTNNLDEGELKQAEISEKIAIECNREIQNLVTQEITNFEVDVIKELFTSLELNDKDLVEYLKSLSSHHLIKAYSVYLKYKYNKLESYFKEGQDSELLSSDEFKALYELANINPYYYQLASNWIQIMDSQDLEFLIEVQKDFHQKKEKIPASTQLLIESAFNHVLESLPLIKITRMESREEIIIVEKTHVILEIELQNNTIEKTLNFHVLIEPVGFSNFSVESPFKRSFKLKTREKVRFFIELGKAKSTNCPISFNFINDIDGKKFYDYVSYLDVKEDDIEEKGILIETKTKQKSSVFISYSSKDADLFKIPDIAKNLATQDDIEDVLYFESESYDNFVEFMNNNIGKCDVVLLFCSPNALESTFVMKEWTSADALGKPIIPIFIKMDHIPPLLRSRVGLEYDSFNFNKNVEELNKLIIKKVSKNSP